MKFIVRCYKLATDSSNWLHWQVDNKHSLAKRRTA